MPEIPHFAFPFQRGADSKVTVVEQDTDEHIMACENVIVRCCTGFREDRPEFGWPFPEFSNAPLDLRPLAAALRRFEPRGNVDVSQYTDAADNAVQGIEIEVQT